MRREVLVILLTLLCTAPFHVDAQGGEPPCQDSVRAEAIGNTIVVSHDQAEWNCCAEIVFELIQVRDTLNLYEFETFEIGPCLCICCFDLTTNITDVDPGDYLVRVLHGETGELFGEVWVTVEIGQWGQPALGETAQSPCGGWTTAVEEVYRSTWGLIKALYH